MPRFRFRAQAALDLRRVQEGQRRETANEARHASDIAERALADARVRFADAMARAHEADAAGGEVSTAIWYRNWIRGQRRELARCEAIAEDRRVQLEDADRALMEARRRVRVLERLRDRAWATFREHERKIDQQRLDELAVLQFAIRQRGEQP